jgi:hypothetical protein
MVARALAIIALGCVVSCSRLSSDERKFIDSWQGDLPEGKHLVDTFEPDHTHWAVIVHTNGDTVVGPSSRWRVDETHRSLVYEHIRYPFPTEGRPSDYSVVINDLGDQTLKLGGLNFTECPRPKKRLLPQFSPP